MQAHTLPRRRRRRLGAAATLVAVGPMLISVLISSIPQAAAEEPPDFPSQAEVEQAQQRAASTARSVEAIQADLAAAGEQLERLEAEQAEAFDRYYAAVDELEQARYKADEAADRAERYSARLERQRGEMADLVADTYQGGASFGQMRAYLVSENGGRLLDRISAFKGVSSQMSQQFDAYAAEYAITEAHRQQAREAAKSARAVAAEAERIRQSAQAAVTEQQSSVAGIQQQREAMLSELAEAQHISVSMARERQDALEQIEAERLAAARRARAQARADRQADLAAQRAARQERLAERRAERREARADAVDRDPAPSRASRPDVVLPLSPTAYYYSQDNYGSCGSYWSSCHTGNDFSTSCGTPVLASTDGVVNIRYDQSWSGYWLVEVVSNQGVVTWYAHMQDLYVSDGQSVMAGQQVGEVGTEGNSTGCHLHFEVRPGGGYPIDPVDWLASHGVYA
ncbi:MAG: murein hydrolase activator EnvC family protein [Nocardioidaceae bacterium]